MSLFPSSTADLPPSITTTANTATALPIDDTITTSAAVSNTITMASASRPAPSHLALNPWEKQALNYVVADQRFPASNGTTAGQPSGLDSLIHPGLYSGSGFDLMSILVMVKGRPNPAIELGAVDCSVAVVVCDLELPDTPIVYASESFCELTGYPEREVLGRNCRFLQQPGPGSPQQMRSAKAPVDTSAAQKMRHAVASQKEIQLPVYNYKRNGQPFLNLLTIIPIQLQPGGHWYAVGFQSER